MKIKLKSDFYDFYDHLFDLDGGIIWERMTRTKRSRADDIKLLHSVGYPTPAFGKIKFFKSLNNTENRYIVYTDPYAHCGEGKCIVFHEDLDNFDDNLYCSVYIPSRVAYHIRHLVVGDWFIVLKYKSNHEWLSSYAPTIKIEQVSRIEDKFKKFLPIFNIQRELESPLVALDGKFMDGILCFFDLNTAPALTLLEGIFSPKEVEEAIRNFWNDLRKG